MGYEGWCKLEGMLILIGFGAQMIDGALGMAYGVTCNSILLAMGYPPAIASSVVHLSEIATTGISGFSHWKLKNVNKRLFKNLVIPGMIGGAIGAYILSSIPDIRKFVAAYLLIVGIHIYYRAFRSQVFSFYNTQFVRILGFVGGGMDAIGGGGWGPIVTTTLIGSNYHPRFAIGSVNTAEFFVTLVQSVAFFLSIGMIPWKLSLYLCIGGVIAAPFSAFLTKIVSREILMISVGTLIIILSLRTLFM